MSESVFGIGVDLSRNSTVGIGRVRVGVTKILPILISDPSHSQLSSIGDYSVHSISILIQT